MQNKQQLLFITNSLQQIEQNYFALQKWCIFFGHVKHHVYKMDQQSPPTHKQALYLQENSQRLHNSFATAL